MAIFSQNNDGLLGALEIIKGVPDAAFTDILNDEQRMTAIRDQFNKLYSNRKVGDGKASVKFFEPSNDRDLLNRIIVYYNARIKWTDPQQRGQIRQNLSCFGQPDGIIWINSVCQDAGISFEGKPTATIKTEQEKEADQAAARDAVADHLSGKKKAVKEQPKPIPIPETINQNADQADHQEPVQPETGAAFLANGIQFILYKPSEAYQMPERSAIIDNYFYDDTISLLYGQAGSYKTWFALWEGVSLVVGKELCGLPVNDPDHKVLYLSLEMTAKDIADRLNGMTKDMTAAERQKVDENFLIVSAESTPGMKANDEFLTALSQLCDDQQFDVIYIDSLADYIAGYDIRSENDMTAILDKLRTFVLKHHVSFRIIHHGTKPTQDTNGSMAGIHTIRDLVDHVYLVKANTQKEITVSADMQQDKSAKSRYGEPTTLLLKFVSDSGSYAFKRIQDAETSSYIEKLSELLTIIKENPGISAGELRTQLHNPKYLTKLIENAVKAGSIIMEKETTAGNRSPKQRYFINEG